ncbi:MAG: PIN domain nuclease [Actinomycetota bacterium]
MILVDSSVWVEFDRASGSASDERLTALIAGGGLDVACTEPVLMEVIAGARDARRERDLSRLLTSFTWLPFDAVTDFDGAARIYRSCRAAGITPRGLIDCMIVNVALRTGALLLTADRDFEQIAAVVPLQLDHG